MSSLRRILSSRANGAKSRGPKTPEGKRITAMNGLRHGLAAKTVVLATESQAGFDELHQACIEQFQPRTKFESYLVLEMAAAKWRQSRIWSVETAALELEMDRQHPQIEKEFVQIDDATRTTLAFLGTEEKSRSISLCLRYESRMLSAFQRAINTFARTAESASEDETGDAPTEPNPISGT